MATGKKSNLINQSEGVIPGSWYKVDLHVHSPSSVDFILPDELKTSDIQEAYIWLLDQALSADLRVMAISDHNDLSGYQEIVELESDLRKTQRVLERSKTEIPSKILDQLQLFERVTILPGVELDVSPNIHMIIIFDPDSPIDVLDDFLDRAGFTEELRGSEKSPRFSNWGIHEACKEADLIGAIAIAAHVDSDKGLFEASKKWGQKRIAAFTEPHLSAMEFVNPASRDQIKSLLSSPDYTRDTSLAFIQSSDFHGYGSDPIGGRSTWVRLDISSWQKTDVFNALKKAFSNPDEYISAPGRPEVKEIQRRLISNPSVHTIDSSDEVNLLVSYLCSFSNSEDGTVVIGRTDKGNWTGIELEEGTDYKELLDAIIEPRLRPIPDYDIEIYPYYGSRVFATVRVRKSKHVCSDIGENKVFFLTDYRPEEASTKKIIELSEDKLIERYSHISITNRLEVISKRISGSIDSIDVLPIIRKIDACTSPLVDLLPSREFGSVISSDYKTKIDFRFNGYSEGQAIFLQPMRSRQPDSYIRFSAPLGKCDLDDEAFSDLQVFSGEKMLFAPGGANYYDNNDSVVVLCRQWKPIVYQRHPDSNGLNFRLITAYLKTSIPIWYSERCFGSSDFRNPSIIRSLPFPRTIPDDTSKEIIQMFDRIIKMEDEFLKQEEEALKHLDEESGEVDEPTIKERAKLAIAHNDRVVKVMIDLERVFYNIFEIDEDEQAIVGQVLKACNMVVFK